MTDSPEPHEPQRGVIAWFASNPVAANILMLAIIVGGLLAAIGIKMELFPEFSVDVVSVTMPYPGAAPEEVEEAICVRIEEEVHALDGVKKVSSTAAEGMGTVMVEVQPGVDTRKVLDDVKTRVDAIEGFPDEAEKPIVQEVLFRSQVIFVAVSGAVDPVTLKRVGEQVRDEINALPGVSQVSLASARPYEVSIEVSETQLRRHGLTLDEVAQAVRRGSLDLSGGSVKTRGGEVLLRTKAQAYTGAEFERVVLLTHEDGSRVLLGDVARVVDGFADTDQEARFNGAPAVLVQVFRVGDENALSVAAQVNDYIARKQPALPEGLKLTAWGDAAVFLQSRLDLLVKNGLQGLALVFVILALFLRFRLATWVTIGIPISFLGALWLMAQFDQSINMLSLFAFILVLGVVVDDAIVVGESIFSEHERGVTGVDAAIAGSRRVAVPVTFAVLTTIVAFMPMLFLPGVMGKFFFVIPAVVIPCLLFSLIESKLVLPAHLAHGGELAARIGRRFPFRYWVALQGLFERGMTGFARRVYQPILGLALEWRYTTVGLALGTMALVVGLIGGGFVKFAFFNPIAGDVVSAQLTMPLGTSAEVTEEAVRRIESAAETLRAELDRERAAGAPSVVRNFLAAVGEQPYRAETSNRDGSGSSYSGAHLGEVTMELTKAEERAIGTDEIARRWRELTGPIPGAVELVFASDIMSAGDAINVQFAGQDVEELRAASEELKARLAEFPGVFAIADSFRGGKRELRLDILPAAEALGLSRADLARQVRQAFHGEEAQRIQRGKNDVKVMVRFPEADRRSLHGLETMRIRTPAGDEVPLASVASVALDRGYATIDRTDRQRTIRVTSDVDTSAVSKNDILKSLETEVLPDILGRHPGVAFSFEGENREQRETLSEMLRLLVYTLFGMYALMAIPFRSYAQPLLVMSAIPFGLVGAVLGHWINGVELSVLSLCGILALAGVVVNDSLVLVDFMNRARADGVPVAQAARTAGVARFRPILLTSLTTFAGLTPLLLEKSVQAQFLVPMAISLAYGVLFATFITLLLLPAAYLVLDDLARLPRRIFGSVTSGLAPNTGS